MKSLLSFKIKKVWLFSIGFSYNNWGFKNNEHTIFVRFTSLAFKNMSGKINKFPFKNTYNLNILKLIENKHQYTSTCPVKNIIFSIFLYLFLILNTSMSFIAFFQNNKLVTFEDIISYILSMTSCELIQNEIDISRTLALFSGGILLFLMIFFCFIDVSRNGFVSKCFGLIWCYIFPSLSLIFFNLFIQGHFSDCKHRNLNLLTLLSQLFH